MLSGVQKTWNLFVLEEHVSSKFPKILTNRASVSYYVEEEQFTRHIRPLKVSIKAARILHPCTYCQNIENYGCFSISLPVQNEILL